VTEVVADLRAGTQNIAHEVNICERPDTVSATSNYNGSNTLPVNMTNDGVCASHGDGTSEVGFGTLPSNTIVQTCNWANLFFRTESDICFNKNSVYTFHDRLMQRSILFLLLRRRHNDTRAGTHLERKGFPKRPS
jgi:hypothetical protein